MTRHQCHWVNVMRGVLFYSGVVFAVGGKFCAWGVAFHCMSSNLCLGLLARGSCTMYIIKISTLKRVFKQMGLQKLEGTGVSGAFS